MADKLIQNLTPAQIQSVYEEYARRKHLYFMKYCWQRENEAFQVGIHTKTICDKLDKAIENFRKGISTYLLVTVCFRHGKSEIVSRYFPAHFLAEFPDCEVVLTSHSRDKAFEFSRDSQNILLSSKFKKLYPKIQLKQGHSAVSAWGIENHLGKSQYFGIQSGTAGAGGHLIIVDDYFGNREQAESQKIRETVNQAFRNDIITRKAPVSIVIVCVTTWHVDDIATGVIPKSMQKDPNFPQFDIIKFPAYDDSYPTGVLFPERFDKSYYATLKAVLTDEQGEYGYLSLMQCTPQKREGNLLKVDKINYIDKEEFELLKPSMRCCRAWDIASSEKQLVKSDPDYTAGIKIWLAKVPSQLSGIAITKVYIEDVIRCRFEALKREQIMIATALADGQDCLVVVESYGGYKDTFTRCKTLLAGICQVVPYHKKEDKLIKATALEVATASGNVTLVKGDWNSQLIKEFSEFPSGSHDDIVDTCSIGINTLAQSAVFTIYSASSLLEELEADSTFFKEVYLNLAEHITVSCQDSYYPKLRKYLLSLLNDTNKTVAANAAGTISKLDLQFNYKDIYVNVD